MTIQSLIEAASFRPVLPPGPSAWMGHLHFAAWVIREVRPQIFVELGTHAGHSYFSFCQSVAEFGLPTKCFAVDTWEGDGVTTGNYGGEVFSSVSSFNQERYAGFSTLLRMTFDQALANFSDGSIALLHIDGLHTYEAVRHDFETWLPKLAPGAVVLFHDTKVYAENFGVHVLWKELTERYPSTMEFVHSSGLGVLQLDNASSDKKLNWLEPDCLDKQRLILYFSVLGELQYERHDYTILKEQTLKLESIVADQAGLNASPRPTDSEMTCYNKEGWANKIFMQYEDFLSLMEDDFRKIRHILQEGEINYEKYCSRLDQINKSSKSIYTFQFDSSGVNVINQCNEVKWDAIDSRVQTTYAHLVKLSKLICLPNLRFAIEFEDMAKDTDTPILCYHKRKNYKGIILIPDFEIPENNYYCCQMYKDNTSFQKKLDNAIFVGSTTGTNANEDRETCNTIDNINNDPSVRISAAKYFYKSKKVIFKLPSVVQCDSKETEEYLRNFSFVNCERIDWDQQFKSKFIISVDGNGPTLTRVAVALLSNSVLLKYNSNWITWYHRALRPHINYIPIGWHEEIDDTLENLRENNFFYEMVSRKASADFSLIFNRANVDRHFASILNEFYAIFFGKNEIYWENRLKLDRVAHLDIDVHFSNVGDVSFWPSQEVFDPSGNVIEGLTIYPASSLFDWRDLSYQVMFEDGTESEMVLGGHFAGTKNKAAKIVGFRMIAKSGRDFQLLYTGIFADGVVQKVRNGEWLRHFSSHIKRIIFQIH